MILKMNENGDGITFDDSEYPGQLVVEFYDEDNSAVCIQFDSMEDIKMFGKLLLDAETYLRRKKKKKGTLQ